MNIVVNERKLKKGLIIITSISFVIGALSGGVIARNAFPKTVVETKETVVTEIEPIYVEQEKETLSIQNEVDNEDEKLENYMVHMGLNKNRAKEIISYINDSNTDVPKALIVAIIEKESTYRNIHSEYSDEDSAGYVQMKSGTIEYLKNKYDDLPTIKSQDDFILRVDAQIAYMVKYLELLVDKYDYDFDFSVSGYRLGINAEKVDDDYTNDVLIIKSNIEKYIYEGDAVNE